MPITSVRYSVEFNVNGLKRWLGAEATVPEGASEDAELDLILDFIRRTDQRVHGTQLTSAPLPPEPIVLPTIQKEVEEPTESLIELIERCTAWAGYNGLNTFSVVKKTDAENQAFLKKKKELGVIG